MINYCITYIWLNKLPKKEGKGFRILGLLRFRRCRLLVLPYWLLY